MNNTVTKPIYIFTFLTFLISLACANSAPTATPIEPTLAPATQTPAPTLVATETPAPTSVPPTATVTEIRPAPTSSLRVLDFRQGDIVLMFDLLSPEILYTQREDFDVQYQSADGGLTWSVVTDPEAAEIQQSLQGQQFWRDPQTPTTLYGISEAMMSLMKSVDSGQTWIPLPVPFEAMSLAEEMGGVFQIDPRNPETLFASTMGSVYKSADGGETWKEIMEGITNPAPSGFWRQRFIFDPSRPDIVYFLDGSGHGLYKSTNGGESWVSLNSSQGQNSFYPGRWLVIDPLDSDFLYTRNITDNQIYASADGGQTWTVTDLGLPTADVYSFAIDPLNPSNRYAILAAGQTSGLFKTLDGGQTWTEITTQLLP